MISGENADKKKTLVEWTPKCQEAFEKLKELCTEAPVLAYPDFTKPFKLHIDACDRGLGAILYQDQSSGQEKPIGFASRSLSKAESNYPAHKLEFLALKWAVTKRFHEYLYGNEFTVYTDNNPLTYILTTAKLDATGHRWVAALAAYNFTLHYRPGKANIDADALSRIPWKKEQTVEPETVNHLLSNVISKAGCVIECYKGHTTTVPNPIPKIEPGKMSVRDWMEAQRGEKGLGKVIDLYEVKKLTKSHKGEGLDMSSPEERGLWQNRSRLVMRQGLLYRKVRRPGENVACMQFVLPTKYWKMAIQGCHDDVGHMGVAQSINLLQDQFYWPGMAKEMMQHVRKCMRCNCFKKRVERAPLEPILATHPMQIVHIDFLTIESGKSDKDYNVLVVTNQFTRFAQAFVTTSQTAQTTAKTLWDKYFVYYGFPERIIADQGRNFESRLINELCKLGRVKKLRTSPYHPQSNGQCERFNATLLSMLGTLSPEGKVNWTDKVGTLVHAYNSTKSAITGFSPHYLMFGREPKLPLDITLGLPNPDMEGVIHEKYVKQLQSRLKWSYEVAQNRNEKEAARQKKYYDLKVRCAPLRVGDVVVPRQKTFRGKAKIQDRWDPTLYEVIEIPYPDMPVFKIRPQGEPEAKPKILHRNLLQPIRQIESSKVEDAEKSPPQSQQALDDSKLKDISKTESDEEIEISTPKGPVTRSMATGGRRLISNCVQVVGGMLQPLGELINKPWGWWHPMAAKTD